MRQAATVTDILDDPLYFSFKTRLTGNILLLEFSDKLAAAAALLQVEIEGS